MILSKTSSTPALKEGQILSRVGLTLFWVLAIFPVVFSILYALLYSLGIIGYLSNGITLEYFGRIWAGISYRRNFDGAEYLNSDGQTQAQKLEYITPLLGLEFNSFVFAYNYSYQSNSIVFDNGGYHQITLGFNFGCRKEKYDCNCPWIK